MDFTLTDEQQALRSAARDWLALRAARPGAGGDGGPPGDGEGRQSGCAPGWDTAHWAELGRLGWLDPGLDAVGLALLAEEAGAALMPGPWLPTVSLAVPAYQAAGRWPERPATLAWAEPAPGCGMLREAAAGTRCRAVTAGGGTRLSGVKLRVPGASADVVVAARSEAGVGLYIVDLTAAPGIADALPTVDASRPLTVLRLAAVPAEPMTGPDVTPAVLRAVRQRLLTLLSAEAVGVARQALALAAEHARTRVQFGRPVGEYQGVAHPLADAAVSMELARCLAHRAAWCIDATDPGTGEAVAAATVAAREAAILACETAAQVLGATGFTWDHPLHRLYRRARWIGCLDGPPRAYRAELAASLLGGPGPGELGGRAHAPLP